MASFRMQDSSTIIKAYPSSSIKNSINDLHTEEKFSIGGPTNQHRAHLPTLEDGKYKLLCEGRYPYGIKGHCNTVFIE